MARTIEVDGTKYPVVENLGYQHSAGCYFREVRMPDGTLKMARAYRASGPWRFHSAADRVAPLREAVARGWPNRG